MMKTNERDAPLNRSVSRFAEQHKRLLCTLSTAENLFQLELYTNNEHGLIMMFLTQVHSSLP